jgi:hypothetical protein
MTRIGRFPCLRQNEFTLTEGPNESGEVSIANSRLTLPAQPEKCNRPESTSPVSLFFWLIG